MPFATITVQPPEGLTTSAPFVPITEGLTYEEFERTLDILIYHRHHTCETLPLAPPALAPTIEGVRDASDELVFRSAGLAMEAARRDPQWEPVFSCERMDIPFRGMYQGITEAQHISELYRVYHLKHNDHWMPYNYSHPDVLERRMYDQPDIERNAFLGGYIWRISETTTAALRVAFTRVWINLGDACRPVGWNREHPWLNYDFHTPLCAQGFPYLAPPEGFRPDAFSSPFNSLQALQSQVHHFQFYAICMHAMVLCHDAQTYAHSSNPVLAPSEDWILDDKEPDAGDEAMMADDKESISSEEPDTPAFNAFRWANEPVHEWSVAADLGPEWVVNDTFELPPLPSRDPSAKVSDFELDAEPVGEPSAAAKPTFGTWGSEIDPSFFGSSPVEWAAAAAQAGPEDWPGYQVLSRTPSATDSGYTTPDGTIGWVDEIERDSHLIQNALNRLEELTVTHVAA
ncbi:hypothetical protein CTheo_9044 [Ceratobasidium theobromae]|uniref:Uncharacterized protein n=1 Tax=Ceratobasidium theobromae TaxID=1582974 RepID=A0A5N5Q800_9AGAM|nr:hypothetical protein CTheo_9044 [Ceratobasidium theobromae]